MNYHRQKSLGARVKKKTTTCVSIFDNLSAISGKASYGHANERQA